MKQMNILLIGTYLSANTTGALNVKTYEYSIVGLVFLVILLAFLYIKEKNKSKRIIELEEEIESLNANSVEKEKQLNENKNTLNKLKTDLDTKESDITNLATQNNILEKNIEILEGENQALNLKLKNSGDNYKEEIDNYKNELKKSSSKFDKAIDFMTKKYEEYVSKKDEIQRLKDENHEIKIRNTYLANQYINVDSISYIQELSLLKIKMKTKEFENILLEPSNPKNKDRYYGVFDINFTTKLGFDITQLKAEINGNTIDIYNIQLKNHGTDGLPLISNPISEIRKWNGDILGNYGTWEIRTDDKQHIEYRQKVELAIRTKIAESNDYIIQFEDIFYKAVKSYFGNIIGSGFELNIHKEDKANALPYSECMHQYNKQLKQQQAIEKEIIEDITIENFAEELKEEIEKIKSENNQ